MCISPLSCTIVADRGVRHTYTCTCRQSFTSHIIYGNSVTKLDYSINITIVNIIFPIIPYRYTFMHVTKCRFSNLPLPISRSTESQKENLKILNDRLSSQIATFNHILQSQAQGPQTKQGATFSYLHSNNYTSP